MPCPTANRSLCICCPGAHEEQGAGELSLLSLLRAAAAAALQGTEEVAAAREGLLATAPGAFLPSEQ